MDNYECLICKKHYSQGGRCMANKSNCLLFEEESRGKVIRTSLKFEIIQNAEIPLIKPHNKIIFSDNGKKIECEIIKINWINMENYIVSVEVDYHENEMPSCEKRKLFKLVNHNLVEVKE
jgi:hypothetical protein